MGGPGVWEFLALDFHGLEVTLLGIGNHGQLGDYASISVPGLEDEIYAGSKYILDASDFADHSASMFEFMAADGPLAMLGNTWALAEVTFQISDPAPAEVPGSAGAALLGAGLGLGIMRRRRG